MNLTSTPAITGTDGRKMSKSYANTIPVTGDPDDIESRVLKMLTDPGRARRHDPGNPEICSVFGYHKLFNTTERNSEIDAECRSGEIGCFDCKKECAAQLVEQLRPFYLKRQELLSNLDYVDQCLSDGAEKARAIEQETLRKTRQLVGLYKLLCGTIVGNKIGGRFDVYYTNSIKCQLY